VELRHLDAQACRSVSSTGLVHTEVVEWLCERGCPVLVTNSCDVPLWPAGQRYFQRRLGYSVARLCPELATSAGFSLETPSWRPLRST
jgi:hypothetical protein